MEITVNASSTAEIIAARNALMGPSGLDIRRTDSWDAYGWKRDVGFSDLRLAYERTGPGHRAVHEILDTCWRDLPTIRDAAAEGDLTPAEVAVNAVIAPLWQRIIDWDRRQMVGRYAGLVLRLADGMALSEPAGRASAIVDAVPVFEDQLRVERWNHDPASEQYGTPAMWQYRMRSVSSQVSDTQGRPDEWASVHPSRVLVWAEGSSGDFLDGVPLLLAGFNALVNLEKVTGGSGEAFLKGSQHRLVFNFSPDADPVAATRAGGSQLSVKDAISEQVDSLNRSTDKAIVLQGAEVNPLPVANIDPEPAWRVNASEFAASVGLPMTVLFGQQTGRLASGEDAKQVIKMAESRRRREIAPRLVEMLRALESVGVIGSGQWVIKWPDLSAPTDSDRLARAQAMVQINKVAGESGNTDGLFTAEQILSAAGYGA